MDSEGSSDQGARFQFIDISSSNARKEARAHVMREFMRQKREEMPETPKATKKSRKRTKKPAEPSSEASEVATKKKKKRVQAESGGQKEIYLVRTESDSSASASPDSSAPDKVSHAEGGKLLVKRPSIRLSTSRPRPGSPQSMVDASRRDPFQSLPMWLEEEDRPLVDHCPLFIPATLKAELLLTRCIRHHCRPRAHVQLQRHATQVRRDQLQSNQGYHPSPSHGQPHRFPSHRSRVCRWPSCAFTRSFALGAITKAPNPDAA